MINQKIINMKRKLFSLFIAALMSVSMWAVEGALSGRFTINASGDQVVFSKGNLQYKDGTGWRFAEHQWDFVGAWNTSDWVDLFGWGTWGEGKNPLNTSTTDGDYSWSTDFNGTLTNAVSTGWYTPSTDIYEYIFNTRSTASGIRYSKATVNNYEGVILLPDDWNSSIYTLINANVSYAWYSSTVISLSDWTDKFEANGAVFIPRASMRDGASAGPGGDGHYWTTTPGYAMHIVNNGLSSSYGYCYKYYGFSVRLVRNAFEQDEDGYYLLSTVKDWQDFATLVQTTPTAKAKMTADINLGDDQTHIGSMAEGGTPVYAGIFDGQGHTLTVNYVGGSDQIVAPFTKTSGATIKNLHVAGSIQSAFAYIGVVGMAMNNSEISNVWMSATMTTSQSGWVQSAAIAGYCDGTIRDCLFTGTFTSNGSGYMGGFYGYTNETPAITNCLSTGTFTQGNWQGGGVHTNCYLKQYPTDLTTGCSWATDEALEDGTIAYNLQNNRTDLVWGQRIGTDATPVLTNDESYRVYKSKNGGYTNNPEDAYEGLQQDGEGNYLLGNLLDWQEFAALVKTTPTANAKMTADINLGDDQTMIGSNNTYPYSGIFDGQGHTLTVAYNNTDAGLYVAPFSYIYGATIRNLHVAGTIQTACQNAGVVSKYGGSGNVMENVWCSLAIQTNWTANSGNWECCSGFVGSTLAGTNASLIMRDCLFTGSVVATSGDESGCFMGYVDSNCSANVSNCLSLGTYTYGRTSTSVTKTRMSIDNSFVKQFPNAIPADMQCTDEQLADGSIAYKLQNNRADLVWGQRIGVDLEPVLTNDESYRVYISKNGGYTNNPEDAYEGLQQDGDGNYLLGCLLDWQEFAELVKTTPTANAKMTADINLGADQTMIGSYSTRYSGTFDGQGHTLTFNYNTAGMTKESSQDFLGAAPFRDIEGATIRNVHTAGSITADKIGASGLVGWAYGTNTIENCWSDVNIVSSNGTADTFCGFVAFMYGTSISITDCIYTGLIQSESKLSHAGFIGYHYSGSSALTNCIVILDEGSDPSKTSPCAYMYYTLDRFSCGDQSAGTYTNCFYYRDFGQAQGTKVTDEQLASGDIAYKLQANRTDLVWGQRIGTDAEPVLTNDESYRVYKSKNGGYTNNPEDAYEGLQQDGEGNYLLGNLLDWQEFAELVKTTPTANAKMTADINLGDDQTVIGVGGSNFDNDGSDYIKYQGTFDGQGHTLTIHYVTDDHVIAPFRFIEEATIKNLRVAGSITTTIRNAGGIVGICFGQYKNSYIENCISSVNIISSYVNNGNFYDGAWHGGIAARLHYHGQLHITDCIFNGSISGENKSVVWGGMLGIPDGTVTFTNCLQVGSFDCSDVMGGSNGSGTISTVFSNGSASHIYINNCYYLNAIGNVQGTQATAEQLADGTTATALQAGRAEEIWVQDGTTPMLKIFATTPTEAITANEDPDHAGIYYSTFYDSSKKYALPNDGTEAYAAEVNNGAMYLHKIAEGNDVLPAGTAVIFKATSGTITLTESDDTPVAISVTNHLRGVDVDTEISSVVTGTCYVLSGGSNGVGFYLYEYPNQLKAHKAYIDLNGGGAAQAPKHLRFVFDSATAIETTEADVKAEKRIENGVLYIIKNGVKYNAQGQTVK